MSDKDAPKSLPKQIWRLGWISFFADVASEMAYPILPLFMRAIGAPVAVMGVVEGISEGVVSLMKGASGVHSDAIGRRLPYIRAGYFLSALGKPIIGFASAWPFVLFARTIDRFGKGLRTTARDALIADAAGKDRLGRAFGLHRALDTAGALVGVIVTLCMLRLLESGAESNLGVYRTIFICAILPGLVSVAMTFALKEKRAAFSTREGKKLELRRVIHELPRPYWRVSAVALLFALANSSDTFLLLRSHQLGFSDFSVVLAYALYNVTYTVISYPAGSLSDKIGRWAVIGAGWLLYAVVYGGFASATTWSLWPLFALYGVYMGIATGTTKALVADYAPAELRGSALGLFYTASGVVTIAASFIAGFLWDRFGASATFGFGAITAFVAVIALFAIAPRRAATL